MTDTWNQDDDNFWNQEGVFEDLVSDRQEQAESYEEDLLNEAALANEKFLSEMAEEEEPDVVIEYAECLSRLPGLRDKCNSLKDYIALISTEGKIIYPSYDSHNVAYEDILHDAIIEVCYKKLVGNNDIDEWSYDQLNSNYIDSTYLLCSHEYPDYLAKMFKLLKGGGIDAICAWLPSVVKYIEKQRGTTNTQERQKYKKSMQHAH